MLKERGIDLDQQFGSGFDFKENAVPGGVVPDMFGVEVELEGRKIKTVDPKILSMWTNHVDNSLRVIKPGAEHTEYVFRYPMRYDAAVNACQILFKFLKENPGTEVFDSYRTSIHVHVNCLKETLRTVVNYITLCLIFDELLVSQNGEHRIGNNFCLRAKDAEGQVEDLILSVTQMGSLWHINHQYRYSSINFASLMKFGTVEFRSLECTTDVDRVIQWIDICQHLKVSARDYADPREIISKFSRRGPIGFMMSHLGKHYAKYAYVPGSHQMLQNGMRLAQDFAFCSEWKKREAVNLPNKKPKAKPYFGAVQPQMPNIWNIQAPPMPLVDPDEGPMPDWGNEEP